MNPDPFTLRQLVWMAEARGDFCWQQTSTISAVYVNMNRDSKSKPVSPDDMNPFSKKRMKKNNDFNGKNVVTGKAAWSMFENIVKASTQSKVWK